MRKYIKISVILISCLAGICILIILASVLLIRQFAKDTGNYEAWSENDGIVFTNLRKKKPRLCRCYAFYSRRSLDGW